MNTHSVNTVPWPMKHAFPVGNTETNLHIPRSNDLYGDPGYFITTYCMTLVGDYVNLGKKTLATFKTGNVVDISPKRSFQPLG